MDIADQSNDKGLLTFFSSASTIQSVVTIIQSSSFMSQFNTCIAPPERDSGMMGGRDRGGRMADMGPDKTDSDWRARPSSDADDGPPKRDDAFGERESETS